MKNMRNADDKDVDKKKMADKKWTDKMTSEAAKIIEKLQEQWKTDSEINQRKQAKEMRTIFSVHPTFPIKPKKPNDITN